MKFCVDQIGASLINCTASLSYRDRLQPEPPSIQRKRVEPFLALSHFLVGEHAVMLDEQQRKVKQFLGPPRPTDGVVHVWIEQVFDFV